LLKRLDRLVLVFSSQSLRGLRHGYNTRAEGNLDISYGGMAIRPSTTPLAACCSPASGPHVASRANGMHVIYHRMSDARKLSAITASAKHQVT